MDSQSQSEELRLLARVKKRRRLCSEEAKEVGTHASETTGATSLKTFVQSALRYTCSGVGESSRAAEEERGGGSESRPKKSSSSRKKRRLASHALQRRLDSVRFPGFSGEEGESEGELSAIDVFPDSESELSQRSDLDEIEEDGERREEVKRKTERLPQGCRSKGGRRRREKIVGRARAIIIGSQPQSPTIAENIQEFDSQSSDSSISSPLHSRGMSLPPHHHTSTPTHHHRSMMTIRDFPNMAHDAIATPTPEFMSIATPPSSPELTLTTQAEKSLGRTTTTTMSCTTSAWIKQIPVEPDEFTGGAANDTTHYLDEMTMKALGHSGEGGRRGRRRKGRMVPGGLGEALERVAQRESSEVTFWEHRARKIQDSDIDISTCLTVHVCSLFNSHSFKVGKCRTLSQQEQQQACSSRDHKTATGLKEGEGGGGAGDVLGGLGDGGHVRVEEVDGGGEIVTVLFSTRCAKFLGLQVGSRVRIHPPWQCLTVPPSQHKVVLCTHFCQPLGHSTPSPLPTLPTPSSPSSTSIFPCTSSHRQRGVEGVRGLRSPHKSPTPFHTTLTKSPANNVAMVPTRLFSATNTASVHRDGLPDPPSRTHGPPLTPTHTARHTSGDEQHNRHSRAHTGDVDSPTQHDITSTPPPPPPPHSPPPPPLTTSASTAATSGTVHSTLLDAMEGACRGVLSVKCRVLRLYRRAVYTTEALGSGCVLGQPLLTKTAPRHYQHSRWCALLCDASGMMCELQITDSTHPAWSGVVRGGEGGVFEFWNIRVSRRTNPARSPELFSLIRCLSRRSSAPRCAQSPSSGEEPPPFPPTSIPIPSFCYVLVSGPDSVPTPWQGGDPAIPALTREPLLAISHQSSQLTRGSIYARVVHYQPEIPHSVRESCDPSTHPHCHSLTPHHGHHLFVVTTPLLSTLSPPHPSHLDPSRLLRLYVKPQFPREGVKRLLSSPGERLLIRDVEMRGEKDGCTECSMDACCMDACSLALPLTSPLTSPLSPPNMVYPQYEFSSDEVSVLRNLPPPTLPLLTSHHHIGTITTVSGDIVGIDEESAFSWPECDSCGNEGLSSVEDTAAKGLYCDKCQLTVASPSIHLQLAVFIQPSDPAVPVLHAQLLQSTIRKLLPVSPATVDEGFDVQCVLMQRVCLDACYIEEIRDTARGTVLCLQEISIEPHRR